MRGKIGGELETIMEAHATARLENGGDEGREMKEKGSNWRCLVFV